MNKTNDAIQKMEMTVFMENRFWYFDTSVLWKTFQFARSEIGTDSLVYQELPGGQYLGGNLDLIDGSPEPRNIVLPDAQ